MTKQEKIERYVQVGGKWRKVDRVPDMVEVVRCKSCKWYFERNEESGMCFNTLNSVTHTAPEWYCKDGKEQNDDTRESNRDFKG